MSAPYQRLVGSSVGRADMKAGDSVSIWAVAGSSLAQPPSLKTSNAPHNRLAAPADSPS